MTGKAPEQEPSIEEILASIRQIISDDDEPQREAVEIELPKEEKFEIPLHQPEPEKVETRQSFADVLELTNEIREEEKVMKYDEEEKFTIPVDVPKPAKKDDFMVDFQDHDDKPSVDESIFTAPAAAATADAFSKLVGNMPIEREVSRAASPAGVTLEDITRDLLRPMLRQWIDENVPRLVERLVEKELEKLSRRVRED